MQRRDGGHAYLILPFRPGASPRTKRDTAHTTKCCGQYGEDERVVEREVQGIGRVGRIGPSFALAAPGGAENGKKSGGGCIGRN